MIDYKSPITQILGEMQTEYENHVLKAVQNVGIHVNREELVKALDYDRGQYEKGYADGSANEEKYKLALFSVVRNNILRDTFADGFGLDVNDMLAVKTVEKIMEQCSFKALKDIYDSAEETLARMGGK